MIVGVLKETYPDEWRVAIVPSSLGTLAKAGLDVVFEPMAGAAAGYPDSEYEDQGARVLASRAQVLEKAQILVQVRGHGANEDRGQADLEKLRSDQVLIGLQDPLNAPRAARQLASTGVTSFALELLPRTTRAQSMDVLSSMATVVGYKAVLLAASTLPRMFPMLMTAAGTLAPARVLVIGAGVAGLQAIATARRLGGVVEAYDVRPAVKEQVESLGAKFVELPLETDGAEGAGGYAKAQGEDFYRKQRELMGRVVAQSHVVVCTAAVPGRDAPVLVTGEMVDRMTSGSVIVDLAAERGGNCELTQPNETVVQHGVTIIGPTNLASTVPDHASQMFSRNITSFLEHLTRDGELVIDREDEITRESMLVQGGVVVHSRVREILGLETAPAGAGGKA